MRIGLVGYFGWGNYGDELFFEAYRRLFAGHELIIFHDPIGDGFLGNCEQLIDSVDVIVIGGGDLIIPWTRSWLYWDERFLAKPVFIYGVGVPTWGKSDPLVLAHYKKFLSHPNVKMIACRDQESVEWVNSNIAPENEVIFYPDIVLALDFPQRDVASRRVGLILRQQTDYVTANIERLAEKVDAFGYSLRMILLGTGRTLSDDYEVLQKFRLSNYDIVVRDSIEELSREISDCGFVVSMKFHGIVAAYKCGVPFISLSGADKFKAFVRQTGNEQYSSTWSDALLPEKFENLVYSGFDLSRRAILSAEAKNGLNHLLSNIRNI